MIDADEKLEEKGEKRKVKGEVVFMTDEDEREEEKEEEKKRMNKKRWDYFCAFLFIQ